MLLTVSTVKDTLPNLQRFVEGNLKGGVDHLVVFLDAGDPEVRAWLDDHPRVSCVRTDSTWWRGERPAELNVRQRINANVVKALLSRCGWAEWIFHVDADEILQVDREVLAAVPAETRVVKLAPLEAVSRKHWDGDPTHFKRLLGKPDLTLLQTLGAIDRPANGAYFHGHVDGKSGVRPATDVWLTLHHGVDAAKDELPAYADAERLRVLHYESFSGEDFVRKWTSILAAGPMANFRPAREPTAVALRALLDKGLTEEQAAPYLMRIFERTTEDDFETLRDLGLLVEADPRAGTHVPLEPPAGAIDQLRALLERVRDEPKRLFHPGEPAAAVEQVLDRVTAGQAGAQATDQVRGARSFLRRS
ncbi:glycosyltransferase family 2 protein [Nocardioides sp. SYSU DS0663]|uniref:glycosyltransferase family 2 protein n=1 Tax=Nocardioides sp. SYSU DS0663 TaxID=3416445 RepID=UPI003F4B6BB8